MTEETPLQDCIHENSPIRRCYGCGADNHLGLRIKSHLQGDEGICTWRPEAHHCSYPGFLNGGIACTLIDCHAAWTVFALECRAEGLDMGSNADLLTGWTKAMHVEFLKPTPLAGEVVLKARVVKRGTTSRTVACSLYSGDVECVRAEVTMVMARVK